MLSLISCDAGKFCTYLKSAINLGSLPHRIGFVAGFVYGKGKRMAETVGYATACLKDSLSRPTDDTLSFWCHLLLGMWAISIATCTLLSLQSILGHKARQQRKFIRCSKGDGYGDSWCFLVLAALSAVLAYHFWSEQLNLSYESWYDSNCLDDECGSGRLGGRWFRDVDLIAEILGIPFERPRRRWWAHQILTSMAPWTMFVAIEGRWRRIPYWPMYVWLAAAFSLPFAQALFFQASLCHPNNGEVILFDRNVGITDFASDPTPQTSRAMKSHMKSANLRVFSREPQEKNQRRDWLLSLQDLVLRWCSGFQLVIVCTLCLSYGLDIFKSFVATLLVVWMLPIILRGRINARKTFGWTSATNSIIYWIMTFIALMDFDITLNHLNMHSNILHQQDQLRYDAPGHLNEGFWEIGKTMDSVNDHPSVKRMGVDLILSMAIMSVWAHCRGLRAQEITRIWTGTGGTQVEQGTRRNLVTVYSDGINERRSQCEDGALCVWVLSPALGLGAMTAAVLGAELLAD